MICNTHETLKNYIKVSPDLKKHNYSNGQRVTWAMPSLKSRAILRVLEVSLALSAYAFLFGYWRKRGDWEQTKQTCSCLTQPYARKTLPTHGHSNAVTARKLTRR